MLFGTDGIRGKIVPSPSCDEDAIRDLQENRAVSPRLMRLVGEALSRILNPSDKIIIGWDERPGNTKLVQYLTQGLHLNDCKVIHAGNCATPGLHNAILETGSNLGCMITASHNPVTDSGIKVFDHEGYKTGPSLEAEISEIMIQLAAEDREWDKDYLEEISTPDFSFNANLAHQELLIVRLAELSSIFAPPDSNSLLLDCSKGAGTSWLSSILTEFGVIAEEVSHEAQALNQNCGAGELSPTDSWTWAEAANSNHLLIGKLTPRPAGEVIAAALDGDGDRCLFIVSTQDGCEVLDGDGMADHILRAANGKWHLAASIESDLSLVSSLSRLNADLQFTQTAVGDRWLSLALRDSECSVIGVEDSGHLVMSAPNPNGGRCLVGDGAASLIAVLCAMAVRDKPQPFEKGFKQRISIKDTNRSLWTGDNLLADEVEKMTCESLGPMKRSGLNGEPNLMLLETDGISIGIRNSGTQAKTNVSLRIAPGIDSTNSVKITQQIVQYLTAALVEN